MLNLTQHEATDAQKKQGVIEPKNKDQVRELLTFDSIPPQDVMEERAKKLAKIAADSGEKRAMIGGAPYFMAYLVEALLDQEIYPAYAFTRREVVEDGNTKTSVFRHVGFVYAYQPKEAMKPAETRAINRQVQRFADAITDHFEGAVWVVPSEFNRTVTVGQSRCVGGVNCDEPCECDRETVFSMEFKLHPDLGWRSFFWTGIPRPEQNGFGEDPGRAIAWIAECIE